MQPNIQVGNIERVLRHDLKDASSKAAEAAGWDGSAISRALSGQQGVPIPKLEGMLKAVGYVIVSRRYLDAIGMLGEVGMHCRCARDGDGECGPSRASAEHPVHMHCAGGRA